MTVSATPLPVRIPAPRAANKRTPRKGGEIRSLTGLRIVAAVWVVLFHLSWAPGSAYTRFWEPVLPLIRHGSLGVDLFFVLSGFVITLTYVDKLGPRPSVGGAVSFWWARICRIWPVYATVTAVFGAWLVVKAALHQPGPVALQAIQPVVDVPHWIEQMLMVQLWHRPTFVGSSWVAPAWSISAEWAAYSLFPVLALVLWRLRNAPPLVTGALSVLSMVPWAFTLEHASSYPFSWAVRIGGGFAAGAFLCLAVRHIPRTERVDRIAARVVVLATVEILVLLWADSAKNGSSNGGGLAVLTFPVLVGALALSTQGASRWLSTDAMVLGGKISFALYLVHMPVFEIGYTLMAWFPRLAPGTRLGTLLLPHLLLAAFVLAYLAHVFVEERSRVALRSLSLPGRRRTPARRAEPHTAPVAGAPVRPNPADEDWTERIPAVVGS